MEGHVWEEMLHGRKSHGSLAVRTDVFMVAEEAGYSASASKGTWQVVHVGITQLQMKGPQEAAEALSTPRLS